MTYRKYFRAACIVIFTQLIAISCVYYTGEEQIRIDIEFYENSTDRNTNECIISGVCAEQSNIATFEYKYINEIESMKKMEVASIDRFSIPTTTKELSDDECIIETCKELAGNIKYTWGMKPTYDDWTVEQGLDCSGFVEYVYMVAGIETVQCIESTLTISLECNEIEEEQLSVGDLGMLDCGGSYYTDKYGNTNYTGDFDGDGEIDGEIELHPNHVGIYLGKGDNGENIWAQCNKKAGTVVIGEYEAFKYFVHVDRKGEDYE